jgi:hypothetical protein
LDVPEMLQLMTDNLDDKLIVPRGLTVLAHDTPPSRGLRPQLKGIMCMYYQSV